MTESPLAEHKLESRLAALPTAPGVYQLKDAGGEILYIGKAKSLRSRVRSYFRKEATREGRLKLLVARTTDVEVIVTDNETEALILENNLIKKLRPRYNINLKDDKTYPYICVKNEPFPRIFPTRRVIKDGSRYFGPYTDVTNMKRALRAIRSIFKIRTCSLNLAPEPIAAGKYRTCLEYHIHKCAGPCVGLQSSEEYELTIAQVEKLLNGHTSALIDLMSEAMREAAAGMQYEDAARLRNQIDAVRKYAERQKVVADDAFDRDLFALAADREENVAAVVLFKVREGKIIGREHKILRRIAGHDNAELMQSFLEHYYMQAAFLPDEVFLNLPAAEPEPLAAYLRKRAGKKVLIKTPQRGQKADLMRMVEVNAELVLGEYKLELMKRGEDRIPFAVKALKEDLRLPRLPRRIECFDVSHLSGTGTVASCVVFHNGRPRKSEYRNYKIRSVESGKPDDFLSMEEVLRRRYKRIAVERDTSWPDLVVVDGGKGQLSSAVKALRETGAFGQFPIIGLSKRLEEVYFPEDPDPHHIAKQSASLQLIQRVRDEAHRFAVELQRKQRKKQMLHSELLDVPGIGPKTAQKLIRTFGSVRRVKMANFEALRDTVGARAADRLQSHFSGPTAA